MTEPMSDERLAEIREEAAHLLEGGQSMCDLLAEVDRMRALDMPGGIEIDPAKITPEQVAEWQAAWDEMLAAGIAMYDLTPQPRDSGRWTPLRNRIPRGNDYAAGG